MSRGFDGMVKRGIFSSKLRWLAVSEADEEHRTGRLGWADSCPPGWNQVLKEEDILTISVRPRSDVNGAKKRVTVTVVENRAVKRHSFRIWKSAELWISALRKCLPSVSIVIQKSSYSRVAWLDEGYLDSFRTVGLQYRLGKPDLTRVQQESRAQLETINVSPSISNEHDPLPTGIRSTAAAAPENPSSSALQPRNIPTTEWTGLLFSDGVHSSEPTIRKISAKIRITERGSISGTSRGDQGESSVVGRVTGQCVSLNLMYPNHWVNIEGIISCTPDGRRVIDGQWRTESGHTSGCGACVFEETAPPDAPHLVQPLHDETSSSSGHTRHATTMEDEDMLSRAESSDSPTMNGKRAATRLTGRWNGVFCSDTSDDRTCGFSLRIDENGKVMGHGEDLIGLFDMTGDITDFVPRAWPVSFQRVYKDGPREVCTGFLDPNKSTITGEWKCPDNNRNGEFTLSRVTAKIGLNNSLQGFEDSDSEEEVAEISTKVEILAIQSKGEKEEADENLCKVCWEAEINCVVLNCAHLAMCCTCAEQLDKCPICRADIVMRKRIFRA